MVLADRIEMSTPGRVSEEDAQRLFERLPR